MTTTSTPAWLLQDEVGLCPCGCIGKRKKGSFVQRTIDGSARVLRQAMFSDEIAAEDGLLQRIDPRVKLVTLLGLLVVTALIHQPPVLIGLYLVALVLAVTSRLSLGFFIKRVWLFIPIFTGIVVLPATFSFITHGEIVVPLGTWFGHAVGLTRQGLTSAALIIIRVAVSISLVVLLTLTTRWNRLLAALRSVGVPKLFVTVLAMAYRYLFHLLGVVTDMYQARKARTVMPETDIQSGRRFVAASAGALFGKSHALAEEVHMSMVARGFSGDVRAMTEPRIGMLDVIWTLGCVLLAILAFGGAHLFGR